MRPGLSLIGAGYLWGVLGMGLLCPASLGAQVDSSQGPAPVFIGGEALSDWAMAQLDISRAAAPGRSRTLQDRLEEVRAMYFLSVDEGDWVDRGKDSLAVLRDQVPPGSVVEPVVQAYRGALEVVRAKHSRWPPNKLKYLNRGAEILDELVAEHPENLEIRYLRLASYRFLPFFLSRDDAVADDLQVLVAKLPQEPEAFSPPIYRAVLRFVLENTALAEEDQARFEDALNQPLQGHGDANNGR